MNVNQLVYAAKMLKFYCGDEVITVDRSEAQSSLQVQCKEGLVVKKLHVKKMMRCGWSYEPEQHKFFFTV